MRLSLFPFGVAMFALFPFLPDGFPFSLEDLGRSTQKSQKRFLHETGLEKRSRIKNRSILREISLRIFFRNIRNPEIPKIQGCHFSKF